MFGKKPKPVKIDMPPMNELELLSIIIKDFQKDLMAAKVQENMYLKESINPVHISRQVAIDSMAQYQKRIKFLAENILAIVIYAKEHGYEI